MLRCCSSLAGSSRNTSWIVNIQMCSGPQVDAVQFLWDCVCETVERSKKGEGGGCILAHCMGLGKTLSVSM